MVKEKMMTGLSVTITILVACIVNVSAFYLPNNGTLIDEQSNLKNKLDKDLNNISKLDIKIKALDNGIDYQEPIKINVSITNNSSQNINIPTFTYNGQTSYLYFGMFVIDFQISRIEGTKEIKIPTTRPFQVYKTLPGPGNKELKPGETWNVVVDLRLWLSSDETGYIKGRIRSGNETGSGSGNLVSGTYKIIAIYNIHPWLRITNNPDKFMETVSYSNQIAINIK